MSNGITLISDDGFRVACNGQKHREVKDLMDKQGYADVWVRHMAGKTKDGMLREIVFYKLDRGENDGKGLEEYGKGLDKGPDVGSVCSGAEKEQNVKQPGIPAGIQPHVPAVVESGKLSKPVDKPAKKESNDNSLCRFGF